MRIVIPVSAGDADLALSLLKHLSDPSDSSHSREAVLLISPLLVDRQGELLEATRSAFASASVCVSPNEDTRGWPWAPNRMFSSAVERMGGKEEWLWLEPDCTPLTRDWLDQIETEYHTFRKPYLGTTRETFLRDPEGKIHGADGRHLIGVAVYPGDMLDRSLLWKFFDEEPFDVYLRWEIVPHAHESELFAHNWKSSNFRGKRGEALSWDGEDQTPIPAKAVLHHGCKDGSLLRVVFSPQKEASVTKSSPTTADTKTKTPAEPIRTLTLPEDDE